MHDPKIEQRFYPMRKAIEATKSLLKDSEVDLIAAIHSLRKLEIVKYVTEPLPSGVRQGFSYPARGLIHSGLSHLSSALLHDALRSEIRRSNC